MMILMHVMHFMHVIIPFSIGIGLGYWLLVVANKQDDGLKLLGQILGCILISITFILTSLGAYYSIKILKNMPMQEEMQEEILEHQMHPMHPMIKKEIQEEIQERKVPTKIRKKVKEEIEEEMQEETQEHQNIPEKNDEETHN